MKFQPDREMVVPAADLVGTVDIAERMGKSNQAVSALLKRYPAEAPAPVAMIGQSRVYLWSEFERFWKWYLATPHNYGGARSGNRRGSGVGAHRTRLQVAATPEEMICRMPGCNNKRFRNSPFCQADTYSIEGKQAKEQDVG